MAVCVILLLLGALEVALYVREKLRAYSVRALILKSFASAVFLALAVCGWYVSSRGGAAQALGVFVVLGLAFGLMGDVWLDLKYVFPEHDGVFTNAGFFVFGVGHVLYMAGLILQYSLPGKALYVLLPIVLGVLLGFGNVLTEKPMKLRFGKMKGVVIAYGALLFSMVLLSGSMALLHGWKTPALILFFAGAVLFALSDLVLSGTYFGVGKDRPADIIANYALYYGGQFLIAFSLAFLAA